MNVTSRTVGTDEADIRLDRWFRRHFPALTQSRIEKLCRTGQVRVDGRRAAAATRLAPGQAVRIPPVADAATPSMPSVRPPDPDTQRQLEAMLLYRDDALLVLNKPAGLPVQGGPGIARHLDAMLDGLRFGHAERPRLVHRLDRDTSGLLLLARSPGIAAQLAAAFRGREVEKTYWAVVAGCPSPAVGRVDLDLVRTGRRTDRVAAAGPDDADRAAPAHGAAVRALTDYRMLDRAGRKFAWLELEPLTGRTHQLRVHCAALGTPILGDAKYGERDVDPGGSPDSLVPDRHAARLHLHARRLVLPHPAGGRLEVAAELPAHMRETFRALGFAAPPTQPPRYSSPGAPGRVTPRR